MNVNDHRSYKHLSSSENKAWKKSGLYGFRTHDLCDIGTVLYQLSILILAVVCCITKNDFEPNDRIVIEKAIYKVKEYK